MAARHKPESGGREQMSVPHALKVQRIIPFSEQELHVNINHSQFY